jgi:hypothetical protein
MAGLNDSFQSANPYADVIQDENASVSFQELILTANNDDPDEEDF